MWNFLKDPSMLGIQDMVLRKVPPMDHHMLVLMECLVLIILNRVIRHKIIKVRSVIYFSSITCSY